MSAFGLVQCLVEELVEETSWDQSEFRKGALPGDTTNPLGLGAERFTFHLEAWGTWCQRSAVRGPRKSQGEEKEWSSEEE